MISEHLFLLCPNNSGSTYLSRALGTSPNVWSLENEGQHVIGFAGPSTMQTPWPLIWAAEEHSLSHFRDSPDYDWERTRKAWYYFATATSENAQVFHTKSPPFLTIADQLAANFSNSKFLLMVRNPYAALEGIVRRRQRSTSLTNPDRLPTVAARHLVTCLDLQRRNEAMLGHAAISFTYEDLCAEPERIATRIAALCPAVGMLDLTQRLAVKGEYDEPLRNMNDQQITRLDDDTLQQANAVFREHRDLLSHFGYSLIE